MVTFRVNWLVLAGTGVFDMRKRILSSVAMAGAMALAVGTTAHAQIVNGNFDAGPSVSEQFGGTVAPFNNQPVSGWTGVGLQFYFVGSSATTVNERDQFNPSGNTDFPTATFTTLSPHSGGNFVALDGDNVGGGAGSISQALSLTVGQKYAVTFDWGASEFDNEAGQTMTGLQVTVGGTTFNTPVLTVPSDGFSGWRTATFDFTATSPTETLKFLALGGPAGLPPIAVLDSVSLAGVPEPATWAMMLIGFGGIGALVRRRRQALVTA
jgi:hypothetical protein